jgi:hypothetical protein
MSEVTRMARELEVYETDVARTLARAQEDVMFARMYEDVELLELALGRVDTLRDCLRLAAAARALLGGA